MPKAPSRKTVNAGKAARPAATAAARPSPVGRLGEEETPKLSREPLSLVVGRTDIADGKVRIHGMSPAVVRVAKGQVVHVKHAYRLQEHSDEREEYRFLLKSGMDGAAHAPSLARLGDQWGVPEDVSGYLQHEYTCSTPGRHTLTFELGAEYCVMGWGDTTVQALDREELKGAVEIVIG